MLKTALSKTICLKYYCFDSKINFSVYLLEAITFLNSAWNSLTSVTNQELFSSWWIQCDVQNSNGGKLNQIYKL